MQVSPRELFGANPNEIFLIKTIIGNTHYLFVLNCYRLFTQACVWKALNFRVRKVWQAILTIYGPTGSLKAVENI